MVQSLFARTAIILAIVFLLFQAMASYVVYRTLVKPVAQRSADDLAGLIVLSAQTWVELPPEVRPAFERELARRHGLRLQAASGVTPVEAAGFPFRNEIELALSSRLGEEIRLDGRKDSHAVWVELPVGGTLLQAGFFPDRYAVRPPLAAVTLVSVGAFIVLLTALLLVRRITVPLAKASQAAGVVGKGNIPESLPETGPRELADLARRFNQMAREVHDLLENRTTLLGGISHDLRTPLTRMQLNIELLREKFDPERLARMETDLAEMNGLIGGYLELARNTQAELPQTVDLDSLVASVAAKHGAIYQSRSRCDYPVARASLERLLDNLMQNAHQYSGGKAIETRLRCGKTHVEISVLDSGPGIPEPELDKVFRPFYRLESSRASSTGGTGLGLAIVKQLAELNGWEIRLVNRPEGGLEAKVVLR
ncbi:MAG: HAMP domain-containing protein [Hydrogenophilaceae bacterium]|nr:HAMP domain-containing protein [Hydrogenophilaceae bacterium]